MQRTYRGRSRTARTYAPFLEVGPSDRLHPSDRRISGPGAALACGFLGRDCNEPSNE
jgi:hypothetical protein